MDQDLTERYSWSAKDTKGYIDAYQYVHKRLNKDHIKWIWAPVGKKNCADYWPGDFFVDIIGLPIYSFPVFDYKYYGKIRSFKEAFGEKYDLVRSFNKPIFLIEFGVAGNYDFEAYWTREAFNQLHSFPLLKTIIFFNSKDQEGVWGEDYETPDWSINQELIKKLIWEHKEKSKSY